MNWMYCHFFWEEHISKERLCRKSDLINYFYNRSYKKTYPRKDI